MSFREDVDSEGNIVQDTFYAISKSEFSLPFHFWRELRDEQYNGGLNLSIPFLRNLNKSNKLKFGISYGDKKREFNETILEYNNVTDNSIMRYNGKCQ